MVDFRPVISFVSKEYEVSAKNPSVWRPILFGNRVVLSRGLCNFDLIDIQPNQARALTLKAVDLQIRSFSPYKNVGTFIQLDDSYAQVWSWDTGPLIEKGIATRNCVPESIFHETRIGMIQIAGIDGFEGQIWSNQGLRASRWWKNKPTRHDWAIFASDSERFVDNFNEMKTTYINLQDTADVKSSIDTRGSIPLNRYWEVFNFKEWIAIFLACVAGPFLFQMSRWAHLEKSAKALRIDVAELRNNLGGKQEDISKAQRLAVKFDNHLETLGYPDLLPALSSMAEVLSPLDVKLARIRAYDQLLSVNFNTTSTIDQVALVKNLEASPYLEETVIAPGTLRNEWIVKGRLNQTIFETTIREN